MSITDRARAEAEKRWTRGTAPGHPLSGPERRDRRIGFEMGAQWAASRPVTDAEVLAALNIITGEHYESLDEGDPADVGDARAALTAAKENER